MAYRAMTLKNIQFFLDNKNLFEDHDIKYGVDVDDLKGRVTEYLDKEKAKYRNLFNLVTHGGEGDEDYQLKNAVLTMFSLALLEQNFWFEEYSSDNWTEEKRYICHIIHHMLSVAKVKLDMRVNLESLYLVTFSSTLTRLDNLKALTC